MGGIAASSGSATVEVDPGMTRSSVPQERSEAIVHTKRRAVARSDVPNDGRLVGAAEGVVTISASKADQ